MKYRGSRLLKRAKSSFMRRMEGKKRAPLTYRGFTCFIFPQATVVGLVPTTIFSYFFYISLPLPLFLLLTKRNPEKVVRRIFVMIVRPVPFQRYALYDITRFRWNMRYTRIISNWWQSLLTMIIYQYLILNL